MALLSRVHTKSVTYAATSLGANMMHSVFVFYYIKIYLHQFHVSQYWFNLSQVVFMIWNAINDPLFGYVQDNLESAIVRTRRHSILYGAPVFALSFVLVWLPWGDYSSTDTPVWLSGVQLMFVLCFYDALFTFVLLAQCALFAEISNIQEDRVRLVQYSQVASLVGSTTVFFCEWFSHSLQYWTVFQFLCIIIACLSCACFVYTGLYARTQYDPVVDTDFGEKLIADKPNRVMSGDATPLRKTIQIFSQPSFLSFIVTNFLQIYHMTFLTNFASIIGNQLIDKEVFPEAYRSIFYGSLFTVPQVLVIVGSPLVSHLGYFKVIQSSFILKIILGSFLFLFGSGNTWLLVTFFVLESAGVSATFSLFNLPLSDVIDCDSRTHNRRHPLSSMVFGLNALVTKPAISLAPMFTVALFDQYGYSQLHSLTTIQSSSLIGGGLRTSSNNTLITATNGNADIHSVASGNADLNSVMFSTICLVPIVIGLLQLCVWSFYTIRDTHKNKKQMIYT